MSQNEHILNTDSQVVLLLCGNFGRGEHDVQPLTPAEYNTLADWLKARGMRPLELLSEEGRERLRQGFAGQVDRIIRLLNRGAALAMAVEGWTNRGLWVISRAEDSYPARLKNRLGKAAPPLLYGAGSKELLDTGGLAVVGSRNADEIALEFTRYVAEKCAKEEIRIVSGGARGIDKEAMLESLKKGGTACGVLSDSLEREALSGAYRSAIREGRLVLVSPYPPSAGFSAGNAMGRNKIIYALADYAMVISADVKGGTWNGATECLRKRYVPLIVRKSPAVPEGNRLLIEQGGTAFDEELLTADFSLGSWMNSLVSAAESSSDVKGVLFDPVSEESSLASAVHETASVHVSAERPDMPSTSDTAEVFWEYVLSEILKILQTGLTEKELSRKLQITAAQAKAWLKRAVAEGKVVKKVKPKPVRYITARSAEQASLFH